MKEKLSAMMDDALAEGERESCVRRLKEDDELRAAWDVYHLIGDTLRGHTAPQVAEQVRARLAAEPTILAPRRTERPRGRLAWYPLAAAASVAAVWHSRSSSCNPGRIPGRWRESSSRRPPRSWCRRRKASPTIFSPISGSRRRLR
jgi:hypothetical protein